MASSQSARYTASAVSVFDLEAQAGATMTPFAAATATPTATATSAVAAIGTATAAATPAIAVVTAQPASTHRRGFEPMLAVATVLDVSATAPMDQRLLELYERVGSGSNGEDGVAADLNEMSVLIIRMPGEDRPLITD